MNPIETNVPQTAMLLARCAASVLAEIELANLTVFLVFCQIHSTVHSAVPKLK